MKVDSPSPPTRILPMMVKVQCIPAVATFSFLLPLVYPVVIFVYAQLYTTSHNYCVSGITATVRRAAFHPVMVFILSHCICAAVLLRSVRRWITILCWVSIAFLDIAMNVPAIGHGDVHVFMLGVSAAIHMLTQLLLAYVAKRKSRLLLVSVLQSICIIGIAWQLYVFQSSPCERPSFWIVEYCYIGLVGFQTGLITFEDGHWQDGGHDGYTETECNEADALAGEGL